MNCKGMHENGIDGKRLNKRGCIGKGCMRRELMGRDK